MLRSPSHAVRAVRGLTVTAVAFAIFMPVLALAQSSIAHPALGQACVQVQIGAASGTGYGCINQELQEMAQSAAPPQANLPLAATSSSNQVGSFNEQSLEEQYGQNFGKSAFPYRPPAPVFNNPLR